MEGEEMGAKPCETCHIKTLFSRMSYGGGLLLHPIVPLLHLLVPSSSAKNMGVLRSVFFLSQVILINLGSFTVSSNNERIDYFCNNTSSNTYQTNRDTLLASLSNKTNEYGYSSSSEGVNPDTVYAMALCRADVELDTCRECIENATAMLRSCTKSRVPTGWPEYDPDDMEGIVWYDYCMVRYSRKAIEGVMAGDPRVYMWNDQKNVTSVEPFLDALRNLLMNDLRVQAAEGGTRRKFDSGYAPGPDNIPIYAFTQCTPDLSKQECEDCLQRAIEDLPNCCGFGQVGGRVLKPSCNFRYENKSFLGVIPDVQGNNNNNTRMRTIIIVVASVTSVVISVIVSFFIIIILRKKNQGDYPGKPRTYVEDGESGSGDGISSVEYLQYDFDTISAATDNFSDVNKLGQGGFGAVYKPSPRLSINISGETIYGEVWSGDGARYMAVELRGDGDPAGGGGPGCSEGGDVVRLGGEWRRW